MKITVIGAGPAGLHAALLFKMRRPDWRVTVLERRGRAERPGFGITLPGYAVGMLARGDPDPQPLLSALTPPWNRAAIQVNDERFHFPFGELVGVSRAALVGYLERRCEAAGVALRFERPVEERQVLEHARKCDLLVGADGARSVVRSAFADLFGVEVEAGPNPYVWLGADRALPEMRIAFRETGSGVLLCAAYPCSREESTVIVECSQRVRRALGLAGREEGPVDDAGLAALGDRLADVLEGARLFGPRSRWGRFHSVRTRSLVAGNVALAGDAGCTVYYSFGAGTPLALRTAATLVESVLSGHHLGIGLAAYEARCRPYLEETGRAARADMAAMAQLDGLGSIDPAGFARAYVHRFDRGDGRG